MPPAIFFFHPAQFVPGGQLVTSQAIKNPTNRSRDAIVGGFVCLGGVHAFTRACWYSIWHPLLLLVHLFLDHVFA